MFTYNSNPYSVSQQWAEKLCAAYPLALSRFCTAEQLIAAICSILIPYLQVPGIVECWEADGLHPLYMLDGNHPAYLPDAIAMRYGKNYEPDEEFRIALEQACVETLHESIRPMQDRNLPAVEFEDALWEQYPLDNLLRWLWRYQGDTLQIPFYLKRDAQDHLCDPFLAALHGSEVELIQRTCGRCYEMDLEELDYEAFCREMHRRFQLATEDYGYFVPEYVWLSHAKQKKGGM